MMRVVIGSKNPVKIAAAQAAFEAAFPDETIDVQGVAVPSGVADQPFSDEETYLGAYNRSQAARLQMPSADFWVGIEGGVMLHGGEMSAFAWVAVTDGRLRGKARSATFFLPPEVARLVRAGKELGEADDIVFGRTNSKQKEGAVGLLTHGIITRQHLYFQPVVLALIPFLNRPMYAPEADR